LTIDGEAIVRIRINHFFYLFLGLIGFKATPAVAAQDIFMCIEGLEGETKDPKYPGCMDVLAWSWGMANSGNLHTGPGGGEGRVSVQDISLTKYIDKASPDIMLHTASGKVFPKVEIYLHKPCVECKIDNPYYTLKIEPALVTSVSTGGSGGEDRLTENVSLNFTKVEWCYSEQLDDGSLQPPICRNWDISANSPY
jgi:type VI secretion system secreted protein Hcp